MSTSSGPKVEHCSHGTPPFCLFNIAISFWASAEVRNHEKSAGSWWKSPSSQHPWVSVPTLRCASWPGNLCHICKLVKLVKSWMMVKSVESRKKWCAHASFLRPWTLKSLKSLKSLTSPALSLRLAPSAARILRCRQAFVVKDPIFFPWENHGELQHFVMAKSGNSTWNLQLPEPPEPPVQPRHSSSRHLQICCPPEAAFATWTAENKNNRTVFVGNETWLGNPIIMNIHPRFVLIVLNIEVNHQPCFWRKSKLTIQLSFRLRNAIWSADFSVSSCCDIISSSCAFFSSPRWGVDGPGKNTKNRRGAASFNKKKRPWREINEWN